MTAETILETVRQAGGTLWAENGKLRYRLPAERPDLIPALRELKSEILDLLADRPAMPAGVRLVRWQPVEAPVRLSQCSTITDTDLFIRSTLQQVGARLSGKDWKAGNWSLSALIDRLAAVGCVVALDDPRMALQ
ncbi:MAG: hypothetical protein ACRD3N_01200 [Terracidiphilus sp.]